jgi:uncharacterized protein YejL (UPF0352 family)
MSASDFAHGPFNHSMANSSCDRLEAELHKKVCATVKKAVNDTLCASLKRGIHEAIYETVEPGTADDAYVTKGSLTDVCVSLEEVTGNGVCASLKQVVADTVCKALEDAISTSLHNGGRWDDEIPFHVTPEALNISCEEVLGNAACAALRQVVSDTVCKALSKTIDAAIASVVRSYKEKGLLSLDEMIRALASVADAGQLHLSNDGIWYAPGPTIVAELCTIIKQRMTNEVCSRLQQLAMNVLCAQLKKAIREEIRAHSERCEQCKNAGRAVAKTAARAAFTYKTGMIVLAIIAVTAVAVAAAAPGSPYQQNFNQILPSVTPIFAPSDHTEGGGSVNSVPPKIPGATPSATPTTIPNQSTSTPTPTPITLSISGPTTMVMGGGGVWTVYINGQLPNVTQASQIAWNSGGLPGGEITQAYQPLGPSGPYGSWVIDSNGSANTYPGNYTLTATYMGASASFTVTRLPNPTVTSMAV